MQLLRPRSKEEEIRRSHSQDSAGVSPPAARTLRELERRVARLEAACANIPDPSQIMIAGPLLLWCDKLPEGTVVPEGGRIVEDIYGHFLPTGFSGHFARERITFDPEDYGKECEIDESEGRTPGESSETPAGYEADEEPRA